jgi:hypothetical protein
MDWKMLQAITPVRPALISKVDCLLPLAPPGEAPAAER